MNCIKCELKGVYKNGTTVFCRKHFMHYFENKVRKTIIRYKLFDKSDKVCIATSGGKDSMTALYLTMIYCKKRGMDYFALAIDEGIEGYRDNTLLDLKEFCDKYEIKLHVVAFKDEFNFTLDEVQDKAFENHNKKPCTVCGVFRRNLLNKSARELGATKLVVGHNLDDEAQSFMMNLLRGDMRRNASLGPVTGLMSNDSFVQRVKPLYFMLEKEVRLYAYLKGFNIGFNECPNSKYSFRAIVRDVLNDIENKVPGVKNGVINSFLDILADLKWKYSDKAMSYCKECGDPCSNDICNTCKLKVMVKC